MPTIMIFCLSPDEQLHHIMYFAVAIVKLEKILWNEITSNLGSVEVWLL